ncbi:hypothetical protein ACL00N_0008425 [Morganella morganii]
MIYTDGTIAIKAGSPIVTGTGTQWKKNIHGVAPGQLISIENGTAPVSMMIRAVNSDTELVLSFNAPVTLSGAKYSIATTVPDTISDAARTMSANQGYIVYFLQAMQQWMTDTGKVEIELPNGQKVTLESVKALNDAISKIPKVVQETGESKTDVMSQDGTVKAINAAKPGDATTTVKGIVQLAATIGTSTTKVPHEKAVSDFIGLMMTAGSGILTLKSPGGTNRLNLNDNGLTTGSGWSFTGGGVLNASGGIFRTNTNTTSIDLIKGDARTLRIETAPHAGSRIMLRFYYINTDNAVQHVIEFPYANGEVAVIGGNSSFDGNGFLRKTSPVIQIHSDGTFDTNDESEGAEVLRTGSGQYHITGILGYNSDGAWGVNGGISVPKDNNGLELVYVDDRVQEDGSLIIETCHRQHAHLPERFQNWRLKEVTTEGERIFYQDGEPCDLPESTRLDVRVEMPQGSVWNVKQRELAEQMEREAQEAAEQTGDSDQ